MYGENDKFIGLVFIINLKNLFDYEFYMIKGVGYVVWKDKLEEFYFIFYKFFLKKIK